MIFINEKEITISGKHIKTARIKEEWYEDINDPDLFIEEIKNMNTGADIFTFWQRVPHAEPKYNYYLEWESLAVLTIDTYANWWENQIKSRTRGLIRKAEKKGIVIKQDIYNDEFIHGMTKIFNETPIRQGRYFWHYGKDFETIKLEFANNIHREDLIGAYYEDELIGFIFLANADRYAITTQIISSINHRDKSTNNALVAKAVELCAEKGTRYLIYNLWVTGSLGEFKRRSGFVKVDVPRYYIPLTDKGKLVLRLHLHHGIVNFIPSKLKPFLVGLREKWYSIKHKDI